MPNQAGGMPALVDGPNAPKCATCGAAEPDRQRNGYCQECGTVFADTLARRFNGLRSLAVAGTTLFVVGGAASLRLSKPAAWGGLAALLAGAVFLFWTALQLRRTTKSMQAAARMRSGVELVFFWTAADRRCLVLSAFYVAVLAALAPYVWFVHMPRYIRTSTEAAFSGRLPEYVALDKNPSEPIDRKLVGQARRAFKLIVIDIEEDGPRISPVHYLLPPDMRAASPDEVGTVALLRYKNVPVQKYQPGNEPAFEIDGELTLIKLANKSVLYRDTFRGGPPPREVPGSGVGYGSRPMQTVSGYLKNLPAD